MIAVFRAPQYRFTRLITSVIVLRSLVPDAKLLLDALTGPKIQRRGSCLKAQAPSVEAILHQRPVKADDRQYRKERMREVGLGQPPLEYSSVVSTCLLRQNPEFIVRGSGRVNRRSLIRGFYFISNTGHTPAHIDRIARPTNFPQLILPPVFTQIRSHDRDQSMKHPAPGPSCDFREYLGMTFSYKHDRLL